MNRTALICLISLGCLGIKVMLDRSPILKNIQRAPASLQVAQAGYQGEALKSYAFGFENLISGCLWVQLLQKNDHRPFHSSEVSWEFAQLDGITELDPRFDSAYEFGTVFLSTLRKDKLGGKILLEKWVKRKPHFWRPTYMLGLHHFLQLRDRQNAGPLILKAASMGGAPEWLTSLGVRLLSDAGAYVQALKVAASLLPAIKDPEAKAHLFNRIRSLNYNLQKQYWNEAYKEYKQAHQREPASLSTLLPLLKSKSREIASVFSDEKLDADVAVLLREHFEFTLNSKIHGVVAKNEEIEEKFGKTDIYEPVNATPTEEKNAK